MESIKRPGALIPVADIPKAKEREQGFTKIGLHAVKSMYQNPKQKDLPFEEILQRQATEYGVELRGKDQLKDFGIGLTETEHKVMEGIIKRFSELDYKGNLDPKTKEDIRVEKYQYGLPEKAYDNIQEIPVIKLTQRELLRYSGLKDNRGIWEKALRTVATLGSKQFCFYYDRLAKDKSGARLIDKATCKWRMETVEGVVDTLFTIKPISENGRFQYFEIYPSFIFLDQRESYFIKIPWGWRKEVEALVGTKQTKYLYLFLTWLMATFEETRSGNESRRRQNINRQKKGLHPLRLNPYSINKTWEAIAETLKMPETIYRRNKAKAISILEKCYSAAKTLGYLKDYKREGLYDTLILNEEKYYRPPQEIPGGAGSVL
jgi:hypothetical protein